MALFGLFAVGCGHEQVTGSARNGWDTPVGHASATDPRYVNPMAAAHPARDRSVFARQEAPPLQPNAGAAIEQPVPLEAPPPAPPPPALPPPVEPAPDVLPPYIQPPP